MASFHLHSIWFKYKQDLPKVQWFPPVIDRSKYMISLDCSFAGKTIIIQPHHEVTTSIREVEL